MHFLFPFLLSVLPITLASSVQNRNQSGRPVYFLLAGDSTTAPDGGWGDGFLATTVAPGSSGHNYGHSGATTASFRAGGDWGKVVKDIKTYKVSKLEHLNHNTYQSIQRRKSPAYILNL